MAPEFFSNIISATDGDNFRIVKNIAILMAYRQINGNYLRGVGQNGNTNNHGIYCPY